MKPTHFPFLLVGPVLIAQAATLNPVPGDPGEESPSSRRSVPTRMGSVDSVLGELNLRVPLGPKLPGRVPLGFTWAFDSHNPLQNSYDFGGGDFRPVIWPSAATKRITYTVLVNGEAWSFPKNYSVAQSNGTFNPPSIMSNRGIENGQNQANQETPGSTAAELAWEAFASPDGRRYFVKTWWKMRNNTTGQIGNAMGGRRMFIVDGDNTIWTDLKGITHFTTVWGDDVSVTETGLTNAVPYPNLVSGGTIVIRNEKYSSHSLTLTVRSNSLSVTNTLGLPGTVMNGVWHYVQRTKRPFEPVLPFTEILYDFCFQPDTLIVNNSLTTTFGWTPPSFGGHSAYPLKTLTYPNGMVESFDYASTPIKRISDYAFDPETGTWVGFRPSSNLVYRSYQYLPVSKVVQRGSDGKGSTVVIERVVPDWTEDANPLGVVWKQKSHTTTLKTYPNPDTSGAYRSVKLTHPSYEGFPSDGIWGNPSRATDGEMQAAYLFVNSVVQKAELFDESGTRHKAVTFGGWDLSTYINPTGAIVDNLRKVIAIPIIAAPTATVVEPTGLPKQVRVQKDWDQFTYAISHVGAESGASTGGGISVTSWGSTAVNPASAINNSSDTTWSWRSNYTFQPTKVVRTLTGSQLSSMRSGASSPLPLETVDYTYDSMQRVLTTTTTLGTGVKKETRTYSGTNPQPDSVTQWAGLNGSGLNFAGLVGKTFTYYGAPHYGVQSETDKLTGMSTSYIRDSLGRVTSTTDAHGVTTSTSYDSWGRVDTVTRGSKGAVGAVSRTYTYDDAGAWTQVRVVAESKTLTSKTEYDDFGRVVKETAEDGGTRTTAYNGYGEKTTQSPWLRPNQASYGNFTFIYDGKGRLKETQDPQGRTLSKTLNDPAWDGSGGVAVTTTDDRNFSRTTITDLLGQKKSLKDPKNQTTTFTYDKFGRMNQMSLGSQVRSYVYDDLGHLTSRTEPEEGETQYSNFTMGGAPGTTLQRGISGSGSVSVSTVFDAKGRPTQISDGSGGTFLRKIEYDSTYADLVSYIDESQADGTMRETYGYDDLYRLDTKVIKDDYNQSFTVSRVLDAMGNVKSLTYPSVVGFGGATVTFGYDSYFRLQTVTKGNTTRAAMTYDQVSGTAVSNTLSFGGASASEATRTTKTFNKGELTNLIHYSANASTPSESNTLVWTAGGLLKSRGNDAFDYDELGRLTYAKTFGINPSEYHTQNFTYDMYGNRIQNSVSTSGSTFPTESLSWTASFGSNNRLPSSVGSPSGSLLTGAQYDNFGRLNRVWAIPGQSTTDTEWNYDTSGRITMEKGVRFVLDAQGLRFRRKDKDNTIKYTIYGFNRDPLSTFSTSETALMASITPQGLEGLATTKKAMGAKSPRGSVRKPTLLYPYGKMKYPPSQVEEPRKYEVPPPEDLELNSQAKVRGPILQRAN